MRHRIYNGKCQNKNDNWQHKERGWTNGNGWTWVRWKESAMWRQSDRECEWVENANKKDHVNRVLCHSESLYLQANGNKAENVSIAKWMNIYVNEKKNEHKNILELGFKHTHTHTNALSLSTIAISLSSTHAHSHFAVGIVCVCIISITICILYFLLIYYYWVSVFVQFDEHNRTDLFHSVRPRPFFPTLMHHLPFAPIASLLNHTLVSSLSKFPAFLHASHRVINGFSSFLQIFLDSYTTVCIILHSSHM